VLFFSFKVDHLYEIRSRLSTANVRNSCPFPNSNEILLDLLPKHVTFAEIRQKLGERAIQGKIYILFQKIIFFATR
jgi:hypothetical protein